MSSVQAAVARGSTLVPIVHADDCGLSVGITDAILACCDFGWLRRTSVVVNGAAWEYAVAALRRRPHVAVVLHLNVFEGRPLSRPDEVDLLVDRAGRFTRSFAALWARGVTAVGTARLRQQLRLELGRQIERFMQAFGDRGPLSVDGHVHYHVLPLVLDELLALGADYPLRAIRLPHEPLYWPLVSGAPRPRLANMTKNLVLRSLSRRARPAIHAQSVTTTAAFVGVLGSGSMSLAHVRAALERLRRTGAAGEIEILFHPGRARVDEASLWDDRPELRSFYLSTSRDREAELLRSPALGDLLRAYGAPTEGRSEPARLCEGNR